MFQNILPPEYDYYVEAYKEYEGHEEEKRFSANFRISRSEATKDSMRRWLEEFCSHSMTTYRIERTYPTETKWFIYRVLLFTLIITSSHCFSYVYLILCIIKILLLKY